MTIDEFIDKWDSGWFNGGWSLSETCQGQRDKMKTDLEEMILEARGEGVDAAIHSMTHGPMILKDRPQNLSGRRRIDSLKPGKELDALVAEKVMGWKLVDDGDIGIDFSGYGRGIGGEGFMHFSPSTDIKAAWEVVDKMGGKFIIGNAAVADRIQTGSNRRPWAAFGINGQKIDVVEGDSVPHAICLVALKAVGYEVK